MKHYYVLVALVVCEVVAENYTMVLVPSGAGSTLEGYLCNGLLTSNTTLCLNSGVHRIAPGNFCSVSNRSNISITGAGRNVTVIQCDGERAFGFFSVSNLTINGVTFSGCGGETTIQFASSSVVLRLESSSMVSMSEFTMTMYKGIGVYASSVNYLTMTTVHFRDCSTNCSGVLYDNSDYLTVSSCVFVNLSFSSDYYIIRAGVTLWDVNVAIIQNSVFSNLTGGGVSAFRSGLSYVTIINSSFSGNSADYGGGVRAKYCYTVVISNSRFERNVAENHGGAVYVFGTRIIDGNPLSIEGSSFSRNRAAIGGAVFVYHDEPSETTTVIDDSSFANNSAPIGAAIFCSSFPRYHEQSFSLNLTNLQVEDNHCDSDNAKGAAVYFSQLNTVYIEGYAYTSGSTFARNSPCGAVEGVGGSLVVVGHVAFINNSAENGGAVHLSSNARLYFREGCSVQFTGNTATRYGGAIFIEGDPNQAGSTVTYCAILFLMTTDNYSISFYNNNAREAGYSIFATPIYGCNFDPLMLEGQLDYITYLESYQHYLGFLNVSDTTNQVISFPDHVDLCRCDGATCDLTRTPPTMTTYPGRLVQLYATARDSGNNTSPATIYTTIHQRHHTPIVSLGTQQGVQELNTQCDKMEYQFNGAANVTLDLHLFTYNEGSSKVLKVTLLPCEPGFVLNNVVGLKVCDCDPLYTKYLAKCNITNGKIQRTYSIWIGLYDRTTTHTAAINTCPLSYCKNINYSLSVGDPEDICNGGRTDILCGHCSGNLSVIFGSSHCQQCSNLWLLTIFVYALVGVFLVAVLFALNLTVTQGTLYGLIFYANTVQANSGLFFLQSERGLFQVIISWMNLDLGVPLCFYDGMDDAAKTGLQFVFPAYLLMLTGGLIMVCRCCLRASNTGCSSRFSKFVGHRAISVLATLLYLSYSKLLRTVIDILSLATLEVSDGTHLYVWFFDGNIRYLHGRHIVLFVCAMAAIIIFILPYVLCLTFIPIIDQYSECSWVLGWLHKKANLLKPINDAYYAPFKGKQRSWLGFRLWLLVFLYIQSASLGSDNPPLLLYIHGIIMIMFMLVQALVQPFGQSVDISDPTYKMKHFYGHFYRWLDLFYLLNYTILALTASYFLDKDPGLPSFSVATNVLVGVACAVFVLIVLYHMATCILGACRKCDGVKDHVKGHLFPQHGNQGPQHKEMEVSVQPPLNNKNSKSSSPNTTTSYHDLREPLIDS